MAFQKRSFSSMMLQHISPNLKQPYTTNSLFTMKKPMDYNNTPEELLSSVDTTQGIPSLTKPDASSSMTKMMPVLEESSSIDSQSSADYNKETREVLKPQILGPTQPEDRRLLLKHYYASKKHGERNYLLRHYYTCKLGLNCPIHYSLSRRHRCHRRNPRTNVLPSFPIISKQVRLNSSSDLLDALSTPIKPLQQQKQHKGKPKSDETGGLPSFPIISKQKMQARLNSSTNLLDAVCTPINPFQQQKQNEKQPKPDETKSLHPNTWHCDNNSQEELDISGKVVQA